MPAHGIPLGQFGLHALGERRPRDPGETLGEEITADVESHVLGPQHSVSRTVGQDGEGGLGHRVGSGQGDHEGRAALEHRDVRGALGDQRRDERDRGGARADDDDPFALDIEVVGPELRVDNRPREIVLTGEVDDVATVVVVVAGREVEEAGGVLDGAIGGVSRDGPALCLAGPVGRGHLLAIVDSFVDAVCRGRLPQVTQDRRAVGNRLRVRPRTEGEGEGVHVRVGADPGIAKEVPGATARRPCLEDREGVVRHRLGHPAGHVDAGEP